MATNLQKDREALGSSCYKHMSDRDPKKLTDSEWEEIVRFTPVREAWGLDDDVDAESFASLVYAAKFNFMSGSPGYVGDLYIIQGDALSEVPPMVLGRDKNGGLSVF